MNNNYCSTCKHYAQVYTCRYGLHEGDEAITPPKEMTCEHYEYVNPLEVRDNSMGYITEGEMWYNKLEYPGWYRKIQDLELDIKAILNKNPAAYFSPVQVKEKWGCFTMYFDASEDVYDEIERLNQELYWWTESHCYACGAPAAYTSLGWLTYYCEDCAKELTAEKNRSHNLDFSIRHYFNPIDRD